MARPDSRCPATPRCLWGPVCPFRRARSRSRRLPAPIDPSHPHSFDTVAKLLAFSLKLVRREIAIKTPHASTIDLDPMTWEAPLRHQIGEHWDHGDRNIYACPQCYHRVYMRKRRAQARADRQVQRDAIEMNLIGFRDRCAPHPEDLDPVAQELARAAKDELDFFLRRNKYDPRRVELIPTAEDR